MTHTIVLPYINNDEIQRFISIGRFLKLRSKNRSDFRFLLVNKKTVAPSVELEELYSQIAPVGRFEPNTTIDAYPQGPDAFFWETMEHINKNFEKDGGFVLWHESDMIAIRPDWVDRLAAEWIARPDALVMGLYYLRRFWVKTRGFTADHINGGACYAKDLVRYVPALIRGKGFDYSLFRVIGPTKRYIKSDQFCFSHLFSLADDFRDPRKTILHGYRQDKNLFIEKTIRLAASTEACQSDKLSQERLPANEKICCDQFVTMFGFRYCPVHYKNTFFSKCGKEILWRSMCVRHFIDLMAGRPWPNDDF